MLSAFGRVIKTADLRRKLLFTLGMIVLYRMGTFIPAPGISYGTVQQCLNANQTHGGAYDIINLFSGGALLQLSIFALGVMPYITASIIIQLLRVVIPRFQELHDEGAQGQAKLTQYTRYLTIALALLNATTIVSMARSGVLLGNCPGIIPQDDVLHILVIIITLCAGTGVIMWMGEQITERGVGNGMSLLIFTSIASSFPNALGSILEQQGPFVFWSVCLVGLAVMLAVVYVEQSVRRVPVQYAKRMIGRRTIGGTSTYIPLKVNMAGVVQYPTRWRSTPRMGELGKYLPYEGRSSAVYRSVLPADSWIHVFLCCGDLRSGRGCRQYEEIWRLHSGCSRG